MTPIIVFVAKYFFVIAPCLVLAQVARCDSRTRNAVLMRAAIVAVVATVFAKIGGSLYFDTRPFVVHHTVPLIPHSPDNGFPSDHTLVAFAAAFLLLPLSRPLAAGGVVVATLVGIARVLCQVHSPIDIVGSVIFAALANLAALPVAVSSPAPQSGAPNQVP